MEPDDHELIERCRSGDDAAFGQLVDRYKDLVFGLIYRFTWDRSAADDLAQDVFLKIHRGIPYFRGEARLSTWIFRIVQNVAAEWRGRRVLEVPLDGQRPAAALAAVDGAFADMERRDRLQKAMDQLPPNYRLLISAHYLRGVQYDVLAEALNIPIGTVKTHLYRARRRLREILEE
jgi:RNA polymerase sigma-70 factor (ECF subfamily)